jgi:uncharacterized membrane protein
VPDKPLSDQVLGAFDLAHLAKDLICVTLWMIVAVLFIYVPVLNQSFLRILFALPVILFIPGYVLIAALFPGTDDLDSLERLALSFGISISVVPLIGFALNYTPWGIRLDPIVLSLIIFTAAMVLIAQYRRSLLPPDQRFFVSFREQLAGIKGEFFEPGQSSMNRTLRIILIIVIIGAIGTTILVIVVPKEGEKYSEFYILGPGGKAADYPTRFPIGETQSLIVGIGNHEYREVNYTVETILINMNFDQVTNTSSINAYLPLDSFTTTLVHNETQEFLYNFTVNNSKYNQLQFLLFNETVPASNVTGQDRIDASYRDLHLWIRVRPRITA